MAHHPNNPKQHQHEHEHEHATPGKRRPVHKDWRVWTGVVLMLIAIAVYVLTLDESLRPGAPPAQTVPVGQ